jgi:phosphinothricin acetyltransferase
MLMRTPKSKRLPARAVEVVLRRLSSPAFAAARRRQALAGLSARQLADIGLIYINGDYRPHPGRLPSPGVTVRDSVEADMPDITRIYAHHVLHGTASFEEIPPNADELAARRAGVLGSGLPYLVAEIDRTVVGYSYATPYRTRSAYRYTIEDSVYVASGSHRRGVGRALLTELVARCERGPWRQMIAVIGDSGNAASIGLHETLGFKQSGTLKSVGWKFAAWTDSVLMQRPLGTGDRSDPPSP